MFAEMRPMGSMPDIGIQWPWWKTLTGPTKSESFNKSWLDSAIFVHNQRSESTACTSFYTEFRCNSENGSLCANMDTIYLKLKQTYQDKRIHADKTHWH